MPFEQNQKLKNHFCLSKQSAFPGNPESGMTIIEILIVIALIGTIMTIVMTGVLRKAEEAKVDLTKAAQTNLKSALTAYKLNTNKFPTTDQGLNALIEAPDGIKGWRSPYVEDRQKLNDAFDNPMRYELLAGNQFKITSAGIDGEFGTSDDILFPEELAEKNPVSTELNIPSGQSEVR